MTAILKIAATVVMGQICDGPTNLHKAQFLHTSAGPMYLYEYFCSKLVPYLYPTGQQNCTCIYTLTEL